MVSCSLNCSNWVEVGTSNVTALVYQNIRHFMHRCVFKYFVCVIGDDGGVGGDDGLEVSTRSRMLPDSMRVGSFTIFCNPNSLIISSSLLCLLAVLVFVLCWLSQSMSGRLKSPAITTLGVFFVICIVV